MNFFGLARRSVFRKPVKSILLLLIVFAISTLLLAGVASKNASIEVQDKTRQAIGAGFLLERNAEYRTKRVREYSEKIGNDKEGSFGGYHQEKEIINGVETWTGWTTNEFEGLDIKDIEKLAKAKGIADYNITTVTTPVNPVNFKRIEDKDCRPECRCWRCKFNWKQRYETRQKCFIWKPAYQRGTNDNPRG